jgi:hypothetical protein
MCRSRRSQDLKSVTPGSHRLELAQDLLERDDGLDVVVLGCAVGDDHGIELDGPGGEERQRT